MQGAARSVDGGTPRSWRLAPLPGADWLLIPLLALALVLRLHDLVTAQRGIWIDEAFSIWVARQPLSQLVAVVQTVDTHPPLFYLLLHFWLLPRHDPSWVRLFPVLTSTLTVAAGFLLGRSVAGRCCGLLCALLFALSPVLVQYGQDGRMYSLFVLLSLLSLWSLLRALDTDDVGRWTIFVVTTLALLYTYTEGVFIPAAEALYVLCLVRGAALRSAILALLIVVAGWSFWLPSILHQFGSISHRFWLPAPDPPRVINTLLTLAANVDEPTLAAGRGAGPLSPGGPWLLLPVGLLMLWGFLRLPALARAGKMPGGVSQANVPGGGEASPQPAPGGDPQSRWLLLGAFLLPHLGALAVSRMSPVYL
ncbi:MAG TPA: glycosyltransferase family 39 protein, partial [Chloroflexota bacterium]